MIRIAGFTNTQRSCILSVLFFLFNLTLQSQKNSNTAEKFLNFLNTYQTDSLENLLSDDFELKRTFATNTEYKSSFLTDYLSYSKSLNAKFITLKVLNNQSPQQFLVEDQSDYFKYLHIHYPTWKITITTVHQKVQQVLIDTTQTSKNYFAEAKKKNEEFMSWLKTTYPDESSQILYDTEGLLMQRIKEYAKKNK